MKNKNTVDRTVKELVDLILELETLRGNKEYRYAFTLGSIQTYLEMDRSGYFNYGRTLQEAINDGYSSSKAEIEQLKNKQVTA
jgi:hypothetical protein